jgi:hypothetical protein
MDKAYSLSTPIIVRSLDVKKNYFRPWKDNIEFFGTEVPYLSAIGVLMYLANNTRLDISFSMNFLSIYNYSPTWKHWDGVKHFFRYLRGMMNMGLFYLNNVNHELVRYVDTWYLSYSYKGQSIYNDVFSFFKKLFFTSAHQNDPKHIKF